MKDMLNQPLSRVNTHVQRSLIPWEEIHQIWVSCLPTNWGIPTWTWIHLDVLRFVIRNLEANSVMNWGPIIIPVHSPMNRMGNQEWMVSRKVKEQDLRNTIIIKNFKILIYRQGLRWDSSNKDLQSLRNIRTNVDNPAICLNMKDLTKNVTTTTVKHLTNRWIIKVLKTGTFLID